MADTQRSLAAIMALLANNATGDISPQDVRDMVESVRNRSGQISVDEVDGAAIVISDTVTYFEATAPAWHLSPAADGFSEAGGNGRLTYVGVADVMVHASCTVSFSSPSNNQVLHVVLAKNGVIDDHSEVIFKIGTAGDAESTAMHVIVAMSTNDYLSVKVRNSTSIANVTLLVANLQAMSMIK